ncbi:flagellar biosynthesis protein FlhB [Oscillibacter sp.]|uniref:flagellar biosynthesis protein FlhB n=1 Tax=Oscillibacter sp. TaxID=1945593 RepID=UPI00339590A7
MPEGNKTEKATPKKRRDQRKKGNVFLSNDAVAVVTLLAGYMALRITMSGAVEQLSNFFRLCMQTAQSLSEVSLAGRLPELLKEATYTLFMALGPTVLVIVAAALGATFLQTRMLVSGESIQPKFSRINPLEGFKKLFSLRSVVEAGKGIIKITILLIIIYHFISGCMTAFVNYMNTDISAVCGDILSRLSSMILQIIIAFIAVAGADFYYQWWDYERQMRMSKQEVKEEYKQTEGDPLIKSKIREAQRKISQSRMMQQVPQADVVIRNPTHVAVALRYKPEQDSAPVVMAKGLDELALRIVKVAEENHIPTVEDVPLARSIYASAELNRQIPPELYGAVADVLVYIYRVNNRDLSKELSKKDQGGGKQPQSDRPGSN